MTLTCSIDSKKFNPEYLANGLARLLELRHLLKIFAWSRTILPLLVCVVMARSTCAAEPSADHVKLTKMLNNVELVGLFTLDGKPMTDLKEEKYEIRKIEKIEGDDDLWSLESRINYGKHDVTVPIVVTIKWAGSTPVIVMDQLLIPGLGTFSARVVFHDNKYSGTWTHGDKGGHLFGRIQPLAK